MRWKTLREAVWILLPLGLLSWFAGRRNLFAGGVFGGLLAFTLYFFRDPERPIPSEASAVVAPADGKVVEIREIAGSDAGEAKLRIGIFLSVFDVHVNRAPISGVVTQSSEAVG